MRLTPVRLRLYPQPVQERWGPDLEAEIQAAGWRSLPNTLTGIAGLWLHPAIWPATSSLQRRLRMTTMAHAVALTCWFISLATAELGDGAARAAGHSPLMSAGMLLIMAGLAFLAPRPILHALATASRIVVPRLILPAMLGAGAVAAVRLGAGGAPPVARAAVLACWWTALATGALQTCRALSATGPHIIPPSPARLRLGTAILTAGSAANTAALLGVSLRDGDDLAATATGIGLLGLLAAFVVVLRDTYHLTTHE